MCLERSRDIYIIEEPKKSVLHSKKMYEVCNLDSLFKQKSFELFFLKFDLNLKLKAWVLVNHDTHQDQLILTRPQNAYWHDSKMTP